MNTILQKPIISITNTFVPALLKVSEKIKNLLIEIAFYIISALLLLSQISAGLGMEPMPQEDRNKVIISLTFLISFLSIKDRVGVVKYRIPIVATWVFFCLTATVIVLMHYKNFGYITLLFLWFIFPFLCFVWNNRRDYDTLYKMLCRPFAHLYIAYSVFVLHLILFSPNRYNIYFFEIVDYRLRATTIHPNHFGILILAGSVCCIYLIFASKKLVTRIFYGIGICFAGIYLIMASSRTSTLCIAVVVTLVMIYALRQKDRRTATAAGILLAVFIVSSCFAMVVPIHQLGINNLPSQQIESEEIDSSDNESAKSESSAEITPAEDPETNNDSSQDRISVLIDRYNPFGKSLNTLTSGRATIWKIFLKHLNLTGEDFAKRDRDIRREYFYWPLAHAHNQYLQTAHTMGIFTGVFELLRNLTAFVYMFITVFKKDKLRFYNIFSILAICSFFLLSMMEYIGEPTRRGISILFLFAFIPLLPSPKNLVENKKSISSEKN